MEECALFVINQFLFYGRAATGLYPPYVTHITDNCTREDCFKGVFADIWHALSKQMNFTYVIRRSYVWGTLIDGSWNGMIGYWV